MNGLNAQSLSLHFNPLLAEEFLWAFGIIAALLLLLSAITTRRFPFLRLLTLAAFIFALLNPSLHEEQRESVPSIAAIIVDESASQSFGKRTERTEAALAHIEQTLKQFDNLGLRVSVKGFTEQEL